MSAAMNVESNTTMMKMASAPAAEHSTSRPGNPGSLPMAGWSEWMGLMRETTQAPLFIKSSMRKNVTEENTNRITNSKINKTYLKKAPVWAVKKRLLGE